MLRTFIWFLGALILFIVTFPLALISLLFMDKQDAARPHPVGLWFANIFVPFTAFLAGTKVEVRGEENLPKQTACFMGNHQSYFDAIIALKYLGPIKPLLIKKELMYIPIANLYMLLLACVPLDRKNIRKSVESLNKMTAKLKAGQSIVIFPEGTRSQRADMGDFKSGAFKPVVKAKVPLVPFVIDEAYHCFEEKHYFKPTVIKLSILPAIMPEEYEELSTAALSKEVQTRIGKELEKIRKA